MRRLPLLAVLAAGAPALAQGTSTYSWDINDTGSDFYIYSVMDQSINFKLYAYMDPQQIAFAASAYEIRGDGDFARSGIVTSYDNKLDAYSDDGDLQPNNDILDIESFQLPPFFGDTTDRSNPILLFELDWEITQFFSIATLTTANHLHNQVFTSVFGDSETYDPITTTATIIIPAPATLALLSLSLSTRRR